jgi:pantoate--beta-alanine ligase
MKIFKSPKSLQSYNLKLKKEGNSIGFVPTMGYLHQGHISLIRAARAENDIVVLSIFINPIQFSAQEDYKRYPRDFKRDMAIAKTENVDIIFCPSSQSLYPAGYLSYVEVQELSSPLCGKSRPGHFKGVATVCIKLFNIVQPDSVYFGRKDIQQAIIIEHMIRDLNMPLNMRLLPLVREDSGLALSSRNRYLSKSAKDSAAGIYRALKAAKKDFRNGEREAFKIISIVKKEVEKIPNVRIDYIEAVDNKRLKPITTIEKNSILAVAVWIDKTRLIDNIVF